MINDLGFNLFIFNYVLLLKGVPGDGREIYCWMNGKQFHKKMKDYELVFQQCIQGAKLGQWRLTPYLDTENLVSRNPWNKEKQSILKTLRCIFIHNSEKYTLKIMNLSFLFIYLLSILKHTESSFFSFYL